MYILQMFQKRKFSRKSIFYDMLWDQEIKKKNLVEMKSKKM